MSESKRPTQAQRQRWKQAAMEQQAKMKEMIQTLAESYQENPETIAELLQFGSKFYRYSVRNTMLIYQQNPHATYVQSYKAWKEMGYSPKEGVHGMKVFVPVKTTWLELEAGKRVQLKYASKEDRIRYQAGEIPGTVRTSYEIGTVFDIAQTTYPPELYPKLYSVGYPSELHRDVEKGLIAYAKERLECPVKVEDLSSISLRGAFYPMENKIRLNERLKDSQRLSTLAHELGHAMQHREMTKSEAQMELEADALGIMVEQYLGFEPTEARKRHLAECYRGYQEEYRNHPGERESFGRVMEQVFQKFRQELPEIEQYIQKYVPEHTLQKLSQPQRGERPEQTNQERYAQIKAQIRIVDYAQQHGYHVVAKGNYYTLKEHDSVIIDPEKNCFWRNSGRGTNPRGSVIDFAMNFVHSGDLEASLDELSQQIEGMSYPVGQIREHPATVKPVGQVSLKDNLPERNRDMRRAYAYLTKTRWIDPDVVQEFVDRKMLYQDVRGNCVFLAYGADGEPNFATFRGTLSERKFLGDIKGSDYTHDFYVNNGAEKLIVTESVIDAMSVMSILKGQNHDFQGYDYLVQAGTKKYDAVLTQLQEHPEVNEVLLAMDHDIAGVKGMQKVQELIGEFPEERKVSIHVPDPQYKDWNEVLSTAMRKMQPLEQIPFLREGELPEIHSCAVQSTEQVEERGFRKRGDQEQYRLVELGSEGQIQPMEINRNVIYTDPAQLKPLVPKMYELVKYEELEEQRAFRTGQSRETEQKLTEVQPQEPEKKLTETQSQEPGKKLAAEQIRVENGLVMAEVQLDGQREKLAVSREGDRYYVETGYAFDETLQEYDLDEHAAEQIREQLGERMEELGEGLLYLEEPLMKPQRKSSPFLERVQQEEQKKDEMGMEYQPEEAMEMML